MQYLTRLKRLPIYSEEARLDAVLITHLPNIRYLCGFTGSSAVLTFCRGVWELFTDGRYTEQARKEVKGATVRVDATPPLAHAARSTTSKLKKSRVVARIAIERDYNGQDPAAVVAELSTAAEGLAARLDAVSANGWARIGIRDQWEMSVDWMARNSVHEGQHHLVDIARVLRTARGR